MFVPTSLSEKMMYSTLRLSNRIGTGTGFIFITSKNKQVVISNRHFAEEVCSLNDLNWSIQQVTKTVSFPIHLNDGSSVDINEEVVWHLHPSEDLAFFDLDLILNKHKPTPPLAFLISRLDSNMIPTTNQLQSLSAIEEVTMIGYPNGLYDSANNLPLIRTGSTSSHPCFDFNGAKKGLVDMACLPGSSGSPVFILNETSYHDKHGNVVIGQGRCLFLGIENAMPVRYSPVYEKSIDSKTGTETLTESKEYIVANDLNLGWYIKSSELSGFNVFNSYF